AQFPLRRGRPPDPLLDEACHMIAQGKSVPQVLRQQIRNWDEVDAYTRYLAGFCLEMIDDNSNAALQYRKANELSRTVAIAPATGRLTPKVVAPKPAADTPVVGKSEAELMPPAPAPAPPGAHQAELVCFILAGRTPAPGEGDYAAAALPVYSEMPSGRNQGMPAWWTPTLLPAYAEIHNGGRLLGRSYVLTDTAELARLTAQKEALRKAAKDATRVAIKEVVSHQIEQQNEALGLLTWFVLMLLEQPDVRRWETLPQWLEVARVNCPADLKEFDVVFKTAGGATVRTLHVTKSIQRRRNIYVAVCRDLVPAPAVPAPPLRAPPGPVVPAPPAPPPAARGSKSE
ncbi:MAG: hypothetical protein NTV49_12605, partial [Kiritimatiellaeota bacterium]|nr:hypothetical protein [Kiritimatiellota bacterium]